MKKRIVGISGAISFVIFLILLFVIDHLSSVQSSQQMAKRWSKDGNVSQVSCFFSVNSNISQDRILEFEHSIDRTLSEASVVQESENPSARLWVDAYSASGTVYMSSDKSSMQANAIGIGGDFFLFHPMTLLSGSFFSGNDLMQDYCIIDREAAWQLFGASNVAGMTVYIGNVPHMIIGVVERPKGQLAEAAGLDSTLVYVSYKTLTELGQSNDINHYEIVMPNPVTGFAEKVIRDHFGADPQNVEILENTTRYSLLSRLGNILKFGTRSMNGKAIIYPYWENIARGYEDILTLLTFLEMLFLVYAAAVALILFIRWWRRKGWTVKQKLFALKDLALRPLEKQRAKRWMQREEKEKEPKAPRTERKKKEKEKEPKAPRAERKKEETAKEPKAPRVRKRDKKIKLSAENEDDFLDE